MGEIKHVLRDKKNSLILIFLGAFAVRLAFSFYFQKFYFGELTFKYKDTATYLLPILNFLEHGIYQGDLFLEDSKYFRVPVYPLFLGLIHVIFGSTGFDYAVATLQSLFDSLSSVLVYLIIYRIGKLERAAFISALIYATYPFVILWVPISYTETVQLFLLWVLVVQMLYSSASNTSLILQGALCAILILTKQYLGLLVLLPLVYLFTSGIHVRKTSALVALALGVTAVMSPWVVRNYIQSGELVVLRGETTGIRSVGRDFESFYKFATLFNENMTPALYEVAHHGTMSFTTHLAFVERHQTEIDEATALAYQCGDSFVQNRLWVPVTEPPYIGCADAVAEKFDNLSKQFWNEIGLTEAFETRRDAVTKILVKGDIVNKNLAISKSSLLKGVLFKYRVLVLVLGMIGVLIIIRKHPKTLALPLFIAAIAMYAYFTFGIVHAELRYLLVPDLLIIIFAGITVSKAFVYIRNHSYRRSIETM